MLGLEIPHPPLPLTLLFPQLALRNALRYFPPDVQELLAPEFAQELRLYGHIYMYRFCPAMKMRSVLGVQLQRGPAWQARGRDRAKVRRGEIQAVHTRRPTAVAG